MGTHPNPIPKVDIDAMRSRTAIALGAHAGAGWDEIAFLAEARMGRARELLAALLRDGDDRKALLAAREFVDAFR